MHYKISIVYREICKEIGPDFLPFSVTGQIFFSSFFFYLLYVGKNQRTSVCISSIFVVVSVVTNSKTII